MFYYLVFLITSIVYWPIMMKRVRKKSCGFTGLSIPVFTYGQELWIVTEE